MAHVQAGAGIVADSVPEKEYAETENKAAALLRAIDLAHEQFGDGGTAMTTTAPRPGDGARVFMIDNYDSFTYNLVQYLGELGADITVKRNDHVTVAEIEARGADAPRRLPRSLHAQRGRHQHGRHRPLRRRAPAGARRLPRPPGHRPGLRRRGAPRRRARARQDRRRSTTTAPACSPACPIPSPRRATTRWSSTRRCRTAWRSRPGTTRAS